MSMVVFGLGRARLVLDAVRNTNASAVAPAAPTAHVARAVQGDTPREPASPIGDCPEVRRALDCCPPWNIEQLDASFDPPRFVVWVYDVGTGMWPCPVCEVELQAVGQTEAYRAFRCLTCYGETFVHVRIPCVHCPDHGHQQVVVPWVRDRAKWRDEGTVPARRPRASED